MNENNPLNNLKQPTSKIADKINGIRNTTNLKQ